MCVQKYWKPELVLGVAAETAKAQGGSEAHAETRLGVSRVDPQTQDSERTIEFIKRYLDGGGSYR